ncbi:hypothetical protein V5N11_031868 [Cardamine amara subsp. amara]|uniref:Uncharacterized protein n=1 Tax=Cardamine amara subsp. amara TaxID=228776 RepID=A0ABD1AU26_CARAN
MEKSSKVEQNSSQKNSQKSGQKKANGSLAANREPHIIKAPVRYGFEEMANYALSIGTYDPYNFREDINSPESDEWMGAVTEEAESLSKNQTWDLTTLPKGKKSYWPQVDFQEKGRSLQQGAIKVQGETCSKRGLTEGEWLTTTRFSPLLYDTPRFELC